MRKYIPLAALVVAVGCLISAFIFNQSNRESYSALAFSCGYIAGQGAIMDRMPNLFPRGSAPKMGSACEDIRDRAAIRGFDPEKRK